MIRKNLLTISALTCLTFSPLASATNLQVSVSGQFSSAVLAAQLAAPNGDWSFNFDLASMPNVSHPDVNGFDAPLTNFSYALNGAHVSAVPASVRFSTAGNLGLFTVYFGPQSGFDSSGNPIPEFSFEGAQAFSGTTTNPTILTGSYPISDWIYSDLLNYDEHTPSASVLSIVNNVPEPTSWLLLGSGGLALFSFRRRASR